VIETREIPVIAGNPAIVAQHGSLGLAVGVLFGFCKLESRRHFRDARNAEEFRTRLGVAGDRIAGVATPDDQQLSAEEIIRLVFGPRIVLSACSVWPSWQRRTPTPGRSREVSILTRVRENILRPPRGTSMDEASGHPSPDLCLVSGCPVQRGNLRSVQVTRSSREDFTRSDLGRSGMCDGIVCAMKTSISVSQNTRDHLARIVQQEMPGMSMDEALRLILFQHETNRDIARLEADPEALASYQAEMAGLAETDQVVGE
jgi:hypothetical protein